MSLPPPPARGGVRDSRLGRMARNDRGAAREAVQQHGALIDAVLGARGVGTAALDDAVIAVVQDLWAHAALVAAPTADDRPLVLACALAALPVPALKDTELDAALVTRLCARVAAGVADATEQRLLTAQRAADPRIDAAARELQAVIASVSTAAGPGRAAALWSRIEPSLR